jgi:hypothetical protein
MWHGRHHSAQKSTSTGCVLLAVKTSASKFPSVIAKMLLSAMSFVLNGLLQVAVKSLLKQLN